MAHLNTIFFRGSVFLIVSMDRHWLYWCNRNSKRMSYIWWIYNLSSDSGTPLVSCILSYSYLEVLFKNKNKDLFKNRTKFLSLVSCFLLSIHKRKENCIYLLTFNLLQSWESITQKNKPYLSGFVQFTKSFDTHYLRPCD